MAEKRGASQSTEADTVHASSQPVKKVRHDVAASDTATPISCKTAPASTAEDDSTLPRPVTTPHLDGQDVPLSSNADTNSEGVSFNSDDKERPYFSHEEWLRLLNCQLANSPKFDEIEDLDRHGCTGALLKITLLKYRYTFVGKATTEWFRDEVEAEGYRYEDLWDIQGLHVPVYLSHVDFHEIERTDELVIFIGEYPKPCDARDKHCADYMLRMSWAREDLPDEGEGWVLDEVKSDIKTCLEAIHECGLLHGDSQNFVFHPDTHKAVAIDFGLSRDGGDIDARKEIESAEEWLESYEDLWE
ncbi:hypothetical protein F5Y16DRAFT_401104 [Xylariaceae sp. FL0255]|nr:hypothetical protein F5Y16DRAFT_401104 [Xylariaceae sp. FL0255]